MWVWVISIGAPKALREVLINSGQQTSHPLVALPQAHARFSRNTLGRERKGELQDEWVPYPLHTTWGDLGFSPSPPPK